MNATDLFCPTNSHAFCQWLLVHGVPNTNFLSSALNYAKTHESHEYALVSDASGKQYTFQLLCVPLSGANAAWQHPTILRPPVAWEFSSEQKETERHCNTFSTLSLHTAFFASICLKKVANKNSEKWTVPKVFDTMDDSMSRLRQSKKKEATKRQQICF